MNTAKREVEQLLSKPPEDCSVEDIQHHIHILDKVLRGLEDAHTNGAVPQDEVEARLNKYLIE